MLKLALEEAIRQGDAAAQAVAAEPMTALKQSGLWSDVILESTEPPSDLR